MNFRSGSLLRQVKSRVEKRAAMNRAAQSIRRVSMRLNSDGIALPFALMVLAVGAAMAGATLYAAVGLERQVTLRREALVAFDLAWAGAEQELGLALAGAPGATSGGFPGTGRYVGSLTATGGIWNICGEGASLTGARARVILTVNPITKMVIGWTERP